jgi:hypothetical protein
MMTQFDAGRIIGDRAGFFCDFFNLILWDKQEFSFSVDKAADEPGTGHAVNMYMRTGNPLHLKLLLQETRHYAPEFLNQIYARLPATRW